MSVFSRAEVTLRLTPRIFLFETGAVPPLAPEDGISLPCIPSAAFGDGTHPTTRLCAGAMDLLCRLDRPEAVLDVGTGTGVLARIARARGSRFVVGTDVDPSALDAAKTNIALDRYPGEIVLSDAAPDKWGPRFSLVIANILEGPLRDLAPALTNALATEGVLLLSGFTPLQTPGLRLTFTDLGLKFVNESHLNGWSLLMFKR